MAGLDRRFRQNLDVALPDTLMIVPARVVVEGSVCGNRRFRRTWLRGKRVREDINHFWMGRSPETMSEIYSRLDVELDLRPAVAGRVGVGFTVPTVVIVSNAPICSKGSEESDVELMLQL